MSRCMECPVGSLHLTDKPAWTYQQLQLVLENAKVQLQSMHAQAYDGKPQSCHLEAQAVKYIVRCAIILQSQLTHMSIGVWT